MRILVLSQIAPFPPLGGGELRTYHLARALATRHEVTLVGFSCGKGAIDPPFPVRVLEHGWEMPPLWKDMVDGRRSIWQPAYEALLNETDEPWFVSCMQSAGMEELLRRVSHESFDLVIIHHSNMARFLPVLPLHVPRVLDLHCVHALMAQRATAGKSGEERDLLFREADRTFRYEKRVASRCALCLTVSEREATAARTLLGIDHVQVIPNGVETAHFAPADRAPKPGSLLFTGRLDSAPNVEAVRFFAQQVLPRVRREVPEAKFHVVGAHPDAVAGLASESVIVHGQVPDVTPFFREASVVVAPMRHGGGTRQKVLEAAASGKAIVSTALGAEGLDFRPGEDLLVADSVPEFAGAVTLLVRDEPFRRRLGQRARRVALRYDWDRIGSLYRETVENFAKPTRLGRRLRVPARAGAVDKPG